MTLRPKALISNLAFSQSQVLCASVAEFDMSLTTFLSRSVVLVYISLYIVSDILFQNFENIGFMYLLILPGFIFLEHVHSPLKPLKM